MALTLLSRRRDTWADVDHLLPTLNSLPAAAVVCDLDMTIVYATPFAVKMLDSMRAAIKTRYGVEVSDLIGMNVHRFHADPRAVEAIMANPAILPHSAVFPLAGQMLQAVVDVIRRDGEPIGYIAIIEDITVRTTLAGEVVDTAGALGGESSQLRDAAGHLDSASRAVTGTSDALSSGMGELLDLMNSVADGAAMIRESTMAVVDSAHRASDNVTELAEASGTIGDFTAVISSIAEQTKLLALNATIEATRAGAAGTGFAVVAQEVKDLAQRSAVAAEKIRSVVESIQRSSQTAGAALSTINEKVDIVGSQQLSVNVIVDNQVKKVEEIVGLTQDLADAVVELDGAVGVTRQSAEALHGRSQQLEGTVASLN